MTDWLLISIICGILTGVISCGFVFYQIQKKKPTLLKPAQIMIEGNDDPTTYNWNLILSIVGKCVAFAGGVFIFINVIIFLFLGAWYIDQRSVGILAIVFIIYTFKEFDKFVTKTISKDN